MNTLSPPGRIGIYFLEDIWRENRQVRNGEVVYARFLIFCTT